MKEKTGRLLPILPKNPGGPFEGCKIARYLFGLITLITIARSLVHMFAPDGGVQSIATIPLDSFTQGGGDAVVTIFSLWGLSQLLIGIVFTIVLFRYPRLIPLMAVLLIAEYTMRIIIGTYRSLETVGTAPGAVGNFVILPIGVLLLILSVIRPKRSMQPD